MIKYALLFIASVLMGAGLAHVQKPRPVAATTVTTYNYLFPKTTAEFAKVAVKITTLSRNSGGTGVILSSSKTGSLILSNKHIAEVIQAGGLVSSDSADKVYKIISYLPYAKHDLALIFVAEDLGVSVSVAKAQSPVFDPETTVGHPRLMPPIVTHGHFSLPQTIQLAAGAKACDGSEKDPQEILMCAFMGAKPIIIKLIARATSSTIQPGSSGSGVFNAKGELEGLVFAGQQDMSFSYSVPLSYIKDFLDTAKPQDFRSPNPNAKPKSLFTLLKMRDHCAATNKCKMMFPGVYGED